MAVRTIVGQFATECYLTDACYNPDSQSPNCGDNMKLVGKQVDSSPDSKCGIDDRKAICCPNSSSLTEDTCQWRSGGDSYGGVCNGQCLEGETSWGDGDKYGDDYTTMCGTGNKMFCCKAPDAKKVLEGCRWTPW